MMNFYWSSLKIFIFFTSFSVVEWAGASQIQSFELNKIARMSQGLLNWHIQSSLPLAQSGNATASELKKLGLCFYKIQEEPGRETLELRKGSCPSADQNLAEYRERSTLLNVFEVGPQLPTRASVDLQDLYDHYGTDIVGALDEEGLSNRGIESLESLGDSAASDSIGQLLFLRLNDKKINIGYLDFEGTPQALCTQAWKDLCYFDYSQDGTLNPLGFKLGYETIVYEYDSIPWQELPSYVNWNWAREYEDFVEIVSADLFSRGNDDSRTQKLFYFQNPATGVKIPISENWYRYFSNIEGGQNLVGQLFHEDGGAVLSSRVRSEWNYLTALQPIHLIKTRHRQSGVLRYRLFIGAEVFYNPALGIEDADCEASEAEEFGFFDLNLFEEERENTTASYLTSLQRKILHGDGARNYDNRSAQFMKIYPAQYVKKTIEVPDLPDELNQKKFVPTRPPVNSEVSNFGLTAAIDLGATLPRNRSWAVVKYIWPEGMLELEELEDAEKATLKSLFVLHQLKEFVNLRRERGGYKIELKGFNPNEMLSNNTELLQWGSHDFFVDPKAVYPAWSQSQSGAEQVYPTHPAHRPTTSQMSTLRYLLSLEKTRRSDESLEGFSKNVVALAQAFENGESVPPSLRDWFVASLAKTHRMAGKNSHLAYARFGLNDYQQRLSTFVKYKTLPEMFQGDWEFPEAVKVLRYSDEGEPSTSWMELSDSMIGIMEGHFHRLDAGWWVEHIILGEAYRSKSFLSRDDPSSFSELLQNLEKHQEQYRLSSINPPQYFQTLSTFKWTFGDNGLGRLGPNQLQRLSRLLANEYVDRDNEMRAFIRVDRGFYSFDQNAIFESVNRCFLRIEDRDEASSDACAGLATRIKDWASDLIDQVRFR